MALSNLDQIFSPLDGVLQPDEFYFQLGFQSGLEIHQQLFTSKKLFCHCPAGIYVKDHDATILRHMRPTLSELGEYDGTALMEFKTKKDIVYLLNRKNVCTYEMDDTPPFMVNTEALDIGFELALLLKCQVVNEVHIIRKQYLDGSIPTGFQRTAIVGVNGRVPFQEREISIIQVAVEEDSCREVFNEGHRITFRTDRLSMPLSEVVTGPDMKTPQEVALVCDLLGRVARVSGKVRRGLGSVREDVNVSVRGGNRVEIKGVSRIKYIPHLVHNEALRQRRLLSIRDHLKKLELTPENIDGGNQEVNDIFAQTQAPLLRKAISQGQTIQAQVFRRSRKVLLSWIQPNLYFAQEFSGRVRVVACLDSPVNLFVRDEPFGIGLVRHTWKKSFSEDFQAPSETEWKKLAQALKATEEDGLVLVWGPKNDTQTAVQEIKNRMVEALEGVPQETRKSFPQGTTDFERVLPGPNRMYPDTDHPPLPVEDLRIQKITSSLPEVPWEREAKLLNFGLGPQTARILAKSSFYPLFLVLAKTCSKENPFLKQMAWVFTELNSGLKRRGVPVESILEEDWKKVFRLGQAQNLFREGIPILVERLAHLRSSTRENKNKDKDLSAGFDAILEEEFPLLSPGKTSLVLSEKEMNPIFSSLKKMKFRSDLARKKIFMEEIMKKYRGVIRGQEVWKKVEQICSGHPLENEKKK